MIQELEPKIKKIQKDIERAKSSKKESDKIVVKQLQTTYKNLMEECFANLSPSDRVYLARHPKRPNINKYIDYMFTDFMEMKGDRLSSDDKSIVGGVGKFGDISVTVIGHKKGSNLEENLQCNFGMPSPSGYRKVQRLAKQAEKFNRPIITFIDTPGAYPGIEAEEQGQGEAIASCLTLFSDIKVPVIAVIIGEGGSGGALAIGVANEVIMLENAVYSVLSPEGFATILWKDVTRKEEACDIMKLTSDDLLELGIVDSVIAEGVGGAVINQTKVMDRLTVVIKDALDRLMLEDGESLAVSRYQKFRQMGNAGIRERGAFNE